MSGSNRDTLNPDDASMSDPRDHDLVPPLEQPHSAVGPAGEADPDEADGMLNQGGAHEGSARDGLSRP